MRSAGFGRRVAEPSGRKLLLIPGSAARGPAEGLPGRGELKEQIRTVLMSRIDPSVAGRISRRTLEAEVAKLVSEIATEQRVQLNEVEESTIAAELTDDMVGLGPVEPFLDDDDITDILVNGPFDIYVERGGKLEKTNARFRDAQHLVNIAQRIASAIGRRIDEASPMVDARLADGSRVNIVLPPLVLNGGTISIRKFPKRNLTLDKMVRQQNLSRDMARLLQIAARAPQHSDLGRDRLRQDDIAERGVTIHRPRRAGDHNRGRRRTAPSAAACRSDGDAAAQHRRRWLRPAARARPQCATHAAGPHHRR
jgi:pilus assembly protein CpaF